MEGKGMLEFDGKTVLVTGGANGIGRGIVQAFVREGATVAALDIASPAMDTTAAHQLLSLQGDVGDPDAARAAVERCYAEWGRLDVLVNNAGIYPNRAVVDMPWSEWRRVLNVNLDGPFLMSQAYAQRAIAGAQGGCIVNISSGAARSGRFGASHYCSSKAGVEMLTRVLAMEFAPHHIRVNCVAPGLILARGEQLVSEVSKAYVAELMRTVPMARGGTPADIAEVVLFLAGDGARYMTGSIVNVDGGASAGRNQLPRSASAQEMEDRPKNT
jgi:NAD(P)-dependent dehydrogenase (short-subunit alcohol dehydrogenase family)